MAFVFARGGSRGIPRKNLRWVGDKPLLVHAIGHAQAAALVDRVVVSTEDAEIAALAEAYGAEILVRPLALATDDSPEWLSWQHAVRALGMGSADTFVSVPCTAPLRLPEDVDAVIREIQRGGCDAVLTVSPARRNPWFNLVTVHPYTGYVYLACDGHPNYGTRQDAPECFDVATVAYAARPPYVLDSARLLMPGRVRAVVVPPERAVDIDTEMDLRIAEMLMQDREERARVAW